MSRNGRVRKEGRRKEGRKEQEVRKRGRATELTQALTSRQSTAVAEMTRELGFLRLPCLSSGITACLSLNCPTSKTEIMPPWHSHWEHVRISKQAPKSWGSTSVTRCPSLTGTRQQASLQQCTRDFAPPAAHRQDTHTHPPCREALHWPAASAEDTSTGFPTQARAGAGRGPGSAAESRGSDSRQRLLPVQVCTHRHVKPHPQARRNKHVPHSWCTRPSCKPQPQEGPN